MTTLSKDHCHNIIQSTFNASNHGAIHFGQVVAQLMEIGVESYHIDYRTGRATYFLAGNDTITLDFDQPELIIADEFNGEAVRAAILGAQQGKIMYPEFKLLSQQSGCIGYIVWIAGRHVSYFGRKGEVHVEHFPGR